VVRLITSKQNFLPCDNHVPSCRTWRERQRHLLARTAWLDVAVHGKELSERTVHHAERRVHVSRLRLCQQWHLLVSGEDEVPSVPDTNICTEKAAWNVPLVGLEFEVGWLCSLLRTWLAVRVWNRQKTQCTWYTTCQKNHILNFTAFVTARHYASAV